MLAAAPSGSIVQRTNTFVANRIVANIEIRTKIERCLAVDNLFERGIEQISDGRMEETRANGAINLKYRGNPRSVAHGRFRGLQSELCTEMARNPPQFLWRFGNETRAELMLCIADQL